MRLSTALLLPLLFAAFGCSDSNNTPPPGNPDAAASGCTPDCADKACGADDGC